MPTQRPRFYVLDRSPGQVIDQQVVLKERHTGERILVAGAFDYGLLMHMLADANYGSVVRHTKMMKEPTKIQRFFRKLFE